MKAKCLTVREILLIGKTTEEERFQFLKISNTKLSCSITHLPQILQLIVY